MHRSSSAERYASPAAGHRSLQTREEVHRTPALLKIGMEFEADRLGRLAGTLIYLLLQKLDRVALTTVIH